MCTIIHNIIIPTGNENFEVYCYIHFCTLINLYYIETVNGKYTMIIYKRVFQPVHICVNISN